MKGLKKLTQKESNALLAKYDKQVAEREASKAYENVGTWNDNYTISKIEKGAFGPIIVLDNNRQAYPHRSLEKVAVGEVVELVIFECPEDKDIVIDGKKRTVKAGATKIVAYPLD
jgi:hypothetical protein